jgi:hypothetical protein
MKTALLATVLLLVITAVSDASFGNPAQLSTPNGVRCVLTVEQRHWGEAADTRIRVRLTNASDVPIELSTVSVFRLEAKGGKPWQNFSYWGPADLKADAPAPLITKELKGAQALSHQPQILRLEAKSEAEFVVHATNLKWEESISSVWPWRQLFKSVQGGEYELHLELDYGLRSNTVLVVVQPKSK